MVRAVVFDLDGVLLDSEQLWDEVRRQVVADHGGAWRPDATAAMQGMSAPEWAAYMRDELGLDLEVGHINDLVVAGLLERYRRGLPLLRGAVAAVGRLAARWPLGLASSSNREVIDEVLAVSGMVSSFRVTVSSEEVARGKPSPDVYLEAADRLGQPAEACVAVEDSGNGIRSALAAGMAVVAVPNRYFPPPPSLMGDVQLVVDDLDQLWPERVERLAGADELLEWRLDEEERESFPASDPHSEWSGPPA